MYIIQVSPTLFYFGSFRVVIYPHDHKPKHVHVIGPDAEAKITLDEMECVFSRGFTEKDIKRIIAFLQTNKDDLLEAWDEYQQ